MAWAKVDGDGRILEVIEERFPGFDAEFSNFEEFCAECVDGVDDYVVRDGLAVYGPKPEKVVRRCKANLAETDYISAKMCDGLAGCKSLADIITLLATFGKEYGDVLAQRAEWRARINELEEQEQA